MTVKINPLKLSCRETAALLIAREDRALGLRDQLALRLHMMVCTACPRFENQLLTLRAAMGKWRNYGSAQDQDEGPVPPAKPSQ